MQTIEKRDGFRVVTFRTALLMAGVIEGRPPATVPEIARRYREIVGPIGIRTVRRYVLTLEACGIVRELPELTPARAKLYEWVGYPEPIY